MIYRLKGDVKYLLQDTKVLGKERSEMEMIQLSNHRALVYFQSTHGPASPSMCFVASLAVLTKPTAGAKFYSVKMTGFFLAFLCLMSIFKIHHLEHRAVMLFCFVISFYKRRKFED